MAARYASGPAVSYTTLWDTITLAHERIAVPDVTLSDSAFESAVEASSRRLYERKYPPTPTPMPTPKPSTIEQRPCAKSADTDADLVRDLRLPNAEFEARLRNDRLFGTTQVKVTLDARGKPVDASVYQSSGSSILDRRAMQVARASTYRAECMNGTAVPGSYLYTADFGH